MINAFVRLIRRTMTCLCLSLAFSSPPLLAQELLSNQSFENPVAPANGNNPYRTLPSWTLTNVSTVWFNPYTVIRPFPGFVGNPTSTPTGGGDQYLDISAASGTLQQTVNFPSAGMVDFGGWFAARDFPRTAGGLIINVREVSTNNIVATASTSFNVAEPIGLWKLASGTNVPVAAGPHIFEVVMPDYANLDLVSLVFKPALTAGKSSAAVSDGISTNNPKMVPGAIAEYTITVASPASYTVTNNSLFIGDTTPTNAALVVNDINGFGSRPALFTAGSTGLSYSFVSLASATDDIEFSDNNGVSWTYTPVAGGNGTDTAVTNIRVRPKGIMAASSTLQFVLRYRIN